MRRSDTIGQLSAALTTFQKSAPKIKKDKTATVPTKAGSNYSYKYADLATIWDSVRGALSDNKLAVIQSPSTSSGEQMLTTVVLHDSGEWVEDSMKLTIVQESPQGQGSAITYARRYMLCAMLGIVADDDTDAQEHRPLSLIQKKQLMDKAKKIVPELGEDPLSLVRFITEVVGKHPSRILENEFEDAVAAVESYTSNAIEEK